MTENIDNLLSRGLEEFCRADTGLQEERNKASSPMKKLRWAISDKAKFEIIVTDLKEYNDGLYMLLSSVDRKRLRKALAPELVASDDLNELNALVQASGEEDNLRSTVGLRTERVELQDQNGIPTPWAISSTVSKEDLKIEGRAIVFDQSSSHVPISDQRALASYARSTKGQMERLCVLVEWKYYDKDLGESLKLEQLTRLETLARLLHTASKPSDLRVPKCIGYITDDWHARVGFIFEPPVSNAFSRSSIGLISLYSKLGGSNIPHIGDRVKLACDLSLSLCLLHTAGWVHKGIRSENVIFFKDDPPGTLSEAYLLGFEYSRPSNNEAHSDLLQNDNWETSLYQHVNARGPGRDRFGRVHDVYALGIVLLEIGFWKKIKEFWHKSYSSKAVFIQDLCHFHAPKLGAKMGKVYMNATMACLKSEFGNTTGDSEAQVEFYWKVIHELSRITV
jgi:HET-S-like prion-inhibition and propagation protein